MYACTATSFWSKAMCRLTELSPALYTAMREVFLQELGSGVFTSCRLSLKLPLPLSPPQLHPQLSRWNALRAITLMPSESTPGPKERCLLWVYIVADTYEWWWDRRSLTWLIRCGTNTNGFVPFHPQKM